MGAGAALLATLCMVLLVRPAELLGPLAWLSGRFVAWHAGDLSEQDEGALLDLARALRLPALALLFACAFGAGALLTWARLIAAGAAGAGG